MGSSSSKQQVIPEYVPPPAQRNTPVGGHEQEIERRVNERLTDDGKGLILSSFCVYPFPRCVYKLINIEYLEISNNRDLMIEKELEMLVNLKQLVISKCTMEIKDGCPHFPNLKKLKLDSVRCQQTKDMKISLFSKSITDLEIKRCLFISVESISELTNLTKLKIEATSISNFDCIINLVNLELLSCTYTKLNNIEGIGNLKKLQILSLSNNRDLSTIPLELIELQELTTLNLYNTCISVLPVETRDLSLLTTLHVSWNLSSSNPYIGKLFLNLSLDDKYSLRNIFPSLNDDACQTENMLDAIFPPLQLGFLLNLRNLTVSCNYRLLKFSRDTIDEPWKFQFDKSEVFYIVKEEFQFISENANNFYFGANGVFFMISSSFKHLFTPDCISKESIASYAVDTTNFSSNWIVDDENKLWGCRNRNSNCIQIQNIPPIESVICDKLGIHAIDSENDVWRFSSLSEEFIPQKTSFPKFKKLFSHINLLCAIDIQNKLIDISTDSFQKQELTNLSDKYNLPPIKFILPIYYSYSSSIAIYVIDFDGIVWAKGYNTNGCLGVGETEKSWISDFKQVQIDEQCNFIYLDKNTVYFLTDSNDIYFTNQQTNGIPILSSYQIPIPRSSQKSARK